MVKFTAQGKTGPLLGLGLTRRNLELLKQGRPIVIDLASMGLPPGEIFIFYGKTEQALTRDILPYITEDTIVHGAETLEKGED